MSHLTIELAEMLRSSAADEWNSYRESHPTFRPDLSDMDLSGTDLSRYDLRAAHAAGTIFRECKFVEADCEDLCGIRANFQESTLITANFRNAVLTRADFRHSHFHQSNFQGANLDRAKLQWANLEGVNLHNASMVSADLRRARLNGANLRRANMTEVIAHRSEMDFVDLSDANLEKAELRNSSLSTAIIEGAFLKSADLRGAVLAGATISKSDLRYANLVRSSLRGAFIADVNIYGASTWAVDCEYAQQSRINISPKKDPPICVDDIDTAQFLHLILDKKHLTNIINITTSRLVLILGRFSGRHRGVIDALSKAITKAGLISVIFDFQKPAERDVTESVSTLAHLSSFVVADLSDVRSVPHELMKLVPHLPSVPVVPIIEEGLEPYALFSDLQRYPWVLPLFRYHSPGHITEDIAGAILQSVTSFQTGSPIK